MEGRVLHRHEDVPGVGTPMTVPLAAVKLAHPGPSIARIEGQRFILRRKFAPAAARVTRGRNGCAYSDKSTISAASKRILGARRW